MTSHIRFHIKGLIMDPVQNSPIVILQDEGETMVLPIWIGFFEANAIALELERIEMPRPMTHDLMRSMLAHLGVAVETVVIMDLRESTYYAEIHLRQGNESVVVDARPSDALALAVRTGATVFVAEHVVEQSKRFNVSDQENWTADDLKRWLEDLPSEDLGKYKM